jgi:hypothetical protein
MEALSDEEVTVRKHAAPPPVVESASDFSAQSSEDESEGGDFSDVSAGVYVRPEDPSERHLARVARALPGAKRALDRAIEKQRRSSRVDRLEAFVKVLADAAVRSRAPPREDTDALRAIVTAARAMSERWAKG